MLTSDKIQLGILVTQIATWVALVWYAIETRSMRIASQKQVRISQEQVRISQELLRASMAQVESLSKPCLTLCSDLRDAKDALLDAMFEKQGASTIGRIIGERFVIENMGNGVALNVSYRIVAEDGSSGESVLKFSVQHILANQKVSTPQRVSNHASGEYKVIFEYESIGARRYRTTLEMSDLVLTAFLFEEITISTGQQ